MYLVCGQLYKRRPLWRSDHLTPLSCCFSAAAVGFSGHPVPARTCTFLTEGLPAASQFRWTETGLPCSALLRYGRCRAPPIPRDRGAHATSIETPVATAASQRRVLFRAHTSHLSRFWVTRLTEVHLRSPLSGLPLACNQWMGHRSFGFLPGFTPRRYQRRMPGVGTSVEHSLGFNPRALRSPIGRSTQPLRPHVAPQCPNGFEPRRPVAVVTHPCYLRR
jgi:hypothetical protein